MTDKGLYGGLIHLRILSHAAEESNFGLGIIEELRYHDYKFSAGNDIRYFMASKKGLPHFTS